MPELPEVETIRSYLGGLLPGKSIDAVVRIDPRMVKRSPADAEAIANLLIGREVIAVDRRGKFLFLRMDTGDALLLHLGMSGRLVAESREAPVPIHTHLILRFGDLEVRLNDPRRFGRVAWVPKGVQPDVQLGVEPLSRHFGTKTLQNAFHGRRVAVKTALLNQQLIAGLGNIYADEALFRASIHPERAAGSLTVEEMRRLARAVKHVLRQSLEHRGTSFSDYVDALGHPGENQAYLHVYGREGKPCRRCRQRIQRVVVGGRSSHFCPRCQAQQPSITVRSAD